MTAVNMLKVKSSLSRFVEAGTAAEIVIARNGRPAARLVAIQPSKTGQRIGVAKGRFKVPDSIDDDAKIAALFAGPAA